MKINLLGWAIAEVQSPEASPTMKMFLRGSRLLHWALAVGLLATCTAEEFCAKDNDEGCKEHNLYKNGEAHDINLCSAIFNLMLLFCVFRYLVFHV